MTARVLICDDQPLIRAGVRTLLGTQPDIEVVGAASDGSATVAAATRLCPDAVLMDVRMPGTDGITATGLDGHGRRLHPRGHHLAQVTQVLVGLPRPLIPVREALTGRNANAVLV